MSEVMDLLSEELSQDRIREIANHLGTDPTQTEAAISAAIPTMIGAMGRTAETNEGAARLASQMQGIGGGSIGDILGSLLGGSSRNQSANARSHEDILPPDFSSPNRTSRDSGNSSGGLFDNLPESTRSSLDRSLGPGNEVPLAPPRRTQSNTGTHQSSPLPDLSGEVFGSKKGRVEDAIGKTSGMDLSKVGPLIAILAPIVLGAMRSKASASNKGGLNPGDLSDMMRRERSSVESKGGGSLLGRLLDQDGDGDFDLSDILKIGMSFFSRRR